MNKKIFFFIIIIFLLFIPIISKAESEDCRNRGKNDCSMGSICSSNADCKSGDCERSTKTDSNGNRIWFCDCGEVDGDWIPFVPETSRTCAQEYGGKAEDWLCKDGAAFSWDLDYCLDKKTPTNTKFPIATTETGFLDTIFDPTGAAVKSVDEIQSILKSPSTKINIPGLNFSEPKAGTDETGQTYVFIPFIGEYLKAIYKWLIAALGVFAIVRLMQAGFGWLMSGGSAEKITVEKKKIQNAIAGLALAVGSYVLLYTINPVLVEFRNLKVPYITEINIGEVMEGEFEDESIGELPNPEYNPSIQTNNNIPFFSQCNKDWKTIPYGKGTVCNQGCGIASLAMVFTFYKNNVNPIYQNLTTPGSVAQVVLKEKIKTGDNNFVGTSYTIFKNTVKTYGLKTTYNIKEEETKKYLLQGMPVIAHVQNKNRERDKNLTKEQRVANSSCRFTGGGHYIVLTAYDQNTDIFSINDPGRRVPPPERKQATAKYLKENCKVDYILVKP